MYKRKKISIVFPAFNEEKNIGKAVSEFQVLGIFDEIIVVDNNSKDNTAKIASQKKAKVIFEKKQGYGFALQKGLREAKGDYIFLCEPDTFIAKDALRLLKDIEKYDIVIGTRTNKKYIGKKANMKNLLLWGNKILAKYIQILYCSKCPLSDCGCTYRVMKREVARKMSPQLKVGGSYFLAEFLVVALFNNFSIKEIPVHYKERIGESKITGSLKHAIIVGMQMFKCATKRRFSTT